MAERGEALGKPFSIELQPRGEAALLVLSGAFGGECRDQFAAQLEATRGGAPARVVIDLRGLTFIDSAGLSMVLRASEMLQESDIPVAVVRGRGQVRRVFELTGADRLVTMVEDPAGISAG